jgi:hypothetical protein
MSSRRRGLAIQEREVEEAGEERGGEAAAAPRVRVADVSPITEAMSSALGRAVSALELLAPIFDRVGAKTVVVAAGGGSYVSYGETAGLDLVSFDRERAEGGLEAAAASLAGRGGFSEAIVVKGHADALVILR